MTSVRATQVADFLCTTFPSLSIPNIRDFTGDRIITLDEAVGDSFLAAECWEMQDQFNGLHIVGNHDQLSLAILNQGSHVVQSILHHQRLVLLAFVLMFGNFVGGLFQTFLLFLLSFSLILEQELEEVLG